MVDQKSMLRFLEGIDAFRNSGDNSLCKLIGRKRSACLEYSRNFSEFLVLNTRETFPGNSPYISVISVFTFFCDSIVYYFTRFSDRCSENAPEIKCDVE